MQLIKVQGPAISIVLALPCPFTDSAHNLHVVLMSRRRAGEIMQELRDSKKPREPTEAEILSFGPLVSVIRDIEKVLKGVRQRAVSASASPMLALHALILGACMPTVTHWQSYPCFRFKAWRSRSLLRLR